MRVKWLANQTAEEAVPDSNPKRSVEILLARRVPWPMLKNKRRLNVCNIYCPSMKTTLAYT